MFSLAHGLGRHLQAVRHGGKLFGLQGANEDLVVERAQSIERMFQPSAPLVAFDREFAFGRRCSQGDRANAFLAREIAQISYRDVARHAAHESRELFEIA